MDSGLSSKKNPNPRQNANILSIATFFFTIPTFIKGYKKELEVPDLYETLSEHKSSTLGNRLAAQWKAEEEKAAKKNRQPSLKSALIRTFGLEFILYGIIVATNEIFIKIAQPIFLGKLISFYIPIKETEVTKGDAYLYAGGVVLCSLVSVFFTHPYMMGVLHVGMKMRVACCSLIYRKALRLSKTALGQTTAGQVVNLLSNDVNRFDVAVIFAHQLWIAPIGAALITYLMYREVQISAVYGVLFLLLFVPLQFLLGRKAAVLRLRTALRTDERVRLMNEIISGIQVIKMYTWEKPFAKLVSSTRKYEIQSIKLVSYIRGIIMSFYIFTTRVSLFISILAYLLYGNDIDATKVFTLTAFYNILRQSMTVYFPQGVAQIAEASVSITRLNTFLLYNEIEFAQERKKHEKPATNGLSENLEVSIPRIYSKEHAITIENATAKWTETSSENTLTNLNLKVKRGGLVAVIGPVGSGKTSLFHAVLKELPLIMGALDVDGEISYASQEPWLFTGSVQQNILFGQEMHKLRYKTVVRKCALERDFKLFPYADKTIVGERGVSLSGGQRARINLARAVYKEADIYLLDDPLSAVDTHVGTQLFEECIQGYLKDKTVILITHQLQYLKNVDHIIILDNGVVKAEGSFSELQESGLDFAKLLNSESEKAEEEKAEKKISRQTSLRRESSVRSNTSSVEDTIENLPKGVEEQKTSGTIGGYVYKAYLAAGANCCVILVILMLFLITQLAASAGDYFITYWTNLEQDRTVINTDKKYNTFPLFRSTAKTSINLDELYQGNGYSRSFWDFSRETCIYIYSGITAATIVFTLVRSFAFFSLCMKSSVKLHDQMFNSITRATMAFFTTNTSGRILNRFSKDMGSIDELLPAAMIDTLQIGLGLIGVVVVVGIVNPWLMIPTFIIGAIFYFLRTFYLTTSRSVKRLEGVTRSPVFAHLNASLQGLTTIRAFNAQSILEKEFDNHQDLHSSAWFCFISSSRAFGFWLDIFCVIYIALVTLSFLVIGDEQFGGNVGLAITQAIGLTGMFQWGMRQSAEMENQMTSVERVLEYSSVEHEPPFESPPGRKPAETWPDRGEIKFYDLYLYYFPDDPPVLKNLNFTIKPLEKVGIVGRTGAGKSSLIFALFRLAEISGSIIIDDIDTKKIGVHDLRSKISIIPQEPVLFSGTMRKNLDPFDEYDDEVLWKALEEVELKEAVSDLVSGLTSKMSEGGSNFSVGQRQLVCLARAIIRNNKILVLDEATANVDPQTDALIQHTIRKKFADCTVLTIAHRLHTVMDSDKVLVMDAGSMAEFDHPHLLLQKQNGIFYGMVQQTGKNMADVLMKVAEDNYNKLQMKKDN